jgi:hypothetical protein
VYYGTRDRKLYYTEWDKKTELVKSGLSDFDPVYMWSYYDRCLAVDGEKLYFLNENILWECNGTDVKQISSNEDDYRKVEVCGGVITLEAVNYTMENSYNAVLTRDGEFIILN